MIKVVGIEKPKTKIDALIQKWESAAESADFYGNGKNDELVKYFRYFIEDLKQLQGMEEMAR